MKSITSGYHIPETIKSHNDSPLWSKPWLATHRYNRMYSIIVTGKTGAGKSLLSLGLGEFLDRTYEDVPRFDISRIHFETEDLIASLRQKLPFGTVDIMDDAGLNIHRRDAMAAKVKDVVKIAQSMRFKRRIIIYNLPHVKFLDSSIEMLSDMRVTVNGYDRNNNITNFSVKFIKTFAGHAKPYYYNPIEVRHLQSGLGIDWNLNIYKRKFYFSKPDEELIKTYEKRKEVMMNKKYSLIELKMRRRKRREISIEKATPNVTNYNIKSEETLANDQKPEGNRTLDEKTTDPDVPDELLEGW